MSWKPKSRANNNTNNRLGRAQYSHSQQNGNNYPNYQHHQNEYQYQYSNNNHHHNYNHNLNYNHHNQYNHDQDNRYKNRAYRHQNDYNNNKKWDNKHKNVKYVKNTGRYQIENIQNYELNETLEFLWHNNGSKMNVEYIENIIFLCGPPGSGKSSVCKYVAKYFKSNHILDVSEMASNVMKENDRKLIIKKVYEKLFQQIVKNQNQHKIFIIDGFLRMEQHVYVAQFIMNKLYHINYIFLVISVDELTSVKRQIERGKKLSLLISQNDENKQQQHQRQRLKASDLDENEAIKRYRKYNNLLKSVLYLLQNDKYIGFNVIDGTKPLKTVYQMVDSQIKLQLSQT